MAEKMTPEELKAMYPASPGLWKSLASQVELSTDLLLAFWLTKLAAG